MSQTKFELRARIAELETLIDTYVHATEAWVAALTVDNVGDWETDPRSLAVRDAVLALKADTHRRTGR